MVVHTWIRLGHNLQLTNTFKIKEGKLMKKGFVVISLLLVLLMVFTSGCGNLTPNKTEEPAAEPEKTETKEEVAKAEYVFKLGYGGATTNPRHLTAEKFKAWVEEQSKGRIQIDLYPSEVLGTDKQMIEMIMMGNLDLSINSQSLLSNHEPKMSIVELPFLFDNTEQAGKILDGAIGEEIAKDLPAKGIRILAYWENGIRQVTNSVRPVEKPEDLKGLKLRAPESKMTIDIFKSLGAQPTPFNFAELYLALQQKTFDGQENPITNIYASKFYEVQKYISITNHKYESCPMIASEKVWQTLPADVQELLKEGAVKFAQEHRKMVAENETGWLEDLAAKGMTVTKPDLDPFREATKDVYEKWEPILGKDMIERVQNEIKSMK